MSPRRRSILLFAIICFVLNASNAEERIVRRKHYTFPPKSELFHNPKIYQLSDKYHNLTYLLCDDYDDVPPPERNCTVVQDTQPERSCPVTLRTNNDGDQGADYLEVFPFGSTRAVILWADYREPGSIICTIVDFTTCRRKDVVLMEITFGVSEVIESTYFADYGDSFELVTISKLFGGENIKYHIDAEGNVISKVDPWKVLPEWFRVYIPSFRPIVADSKPKAYLHVRSSKVSLTSPSGSSKQLAEFPEGTDPNWKRAFSTAHKTIGLAVPVDNRRVDVLLFDQEGELKLNTSVQHPMNVRFLALRNLADGGFLLFTLCSNEYADYHNGYHWSIHADAYYLTRVDANGKVVGTIKGEPEPNCQGKHKDGLGLQVFENEAKEYCYAVECSLFFEGIFTGLTSSGAQLDLLVKCFTNEDFSKSEAVVNL